MSKASYVDPDANFCSRVSFQVSYLPGAYILQSTSPPYNSVSFDNKTFPTRYYSAGKSNWDQYLVDWSLCDYNLSFGISLSTPPDYITLCNLLLSRRIPGFDEGGGTMSGVATVETSGGPGRDIIDTSLSTPTDIVLKTIDGTDDSILVTDNSSYLDLKANIYSLVRAALTDPYFVSFLSDASSTASVSTTTNTLQLFSTDAIQISSALGNYNIPNIQNTPASTRVLCVTSGGTLGYLNLSDIASYNKLAFNVTAVSSTSAAFVTMMSVTPVNWARWSSVGQTMRLTMKGTAVNSTGGNSNVAFRSRIDGVAGAGVANITVPGNSAIFWQITGNITILSIAVGVATCEWVYEVKGGVNDTVSNYTGLITTVNINITTGHTYALDMAAINATSPVTQTSFLITLE